MNAAAAPSDDERLARVALARLGEPGETRLAGLAAELGAVRLYEALCAERDPRGLLADVAGRLAGVDPERDLRRAEKLGIRYVIPGDAEWPSRLDDLAGAGSLHERSGAPIGLWVRGPLDLSSLDRSLAVVGSRSATTYGLRVADEIAATAARSGVSVISGAAFGIDQAAHRGALAVGGMTVAVLACGADRAYPEAHRALIDHIGSVGAVVSESPPGCSPTRIRFLARNRLIAALGTGTVIVEAAIRSGALNTANWTDRLNRVVMGVPGPVTSAQSQGVHQLVRTGAASLVTCGSDVLELISLAGDHLREDPREPTRPRDRLTSRQRQVIDAVPVRAPAPVDSVARTAGMGLLEVRSTLTRLAERGLVELVRGGWRLVDTRGGRGPGEEAKLVGLPGSAGDSLRT
ncbi:DNA-processing protein DprA [Nocardioides sp. LHG3406-4]|uniref:DNA-processing protein DprA n=1 Tax=Nocardioides sp. LHG3406-4 TaxID=2804575 RepID=UPI003CF88272